MKKKFKKQVLQKSILSKEKNSFFDRMKPKIQIIILAAVFIATTLYFFAPYVLDGNTPLGTDVVGSQGRGHIAQQWSEETGEFPYWNPGIFCGMPNYMRHVPQVIHLDTILELVGKIIYSIYLYLFIGALGIFLLLKYKKIPWYISIIVAVAFVLLPDWQALVGEGHFAKLRTIMVLPLFIFSFNYFFDKNSWVSAGIFALIFSWVIRTQHIQIIFYGVLLLLFVFIYPFIRLFIEKKIRYALSLSLKFIVALGLAFMISSLPFLTLQEYADYSTRGGNPIQLSEEKISAKKSGGVDFDYATQWSLAPSEVIDFFIPRFHGGYSNEIYDGSKYPQYEGQNFPGYWGDKPFNGNYATMGIILFLFAIIGVIYYRKDKFIIA
ncbi:MAG: hypothetical protein JW866_01695, partial [Ignavibacteriales bacterium]|nr:hypothetical protein [Ignavibacteriales bacterium]